MRANPAMPYFVGGAALLLILIVEWLPGGEPAALPPARVPHLAPADQNAASKDTGDWADAITQRPLFSVGRRPPKAAQGTHTASGSGLPRLSGIMITPSERHAIFMPDSGKPMTLGEGAVLDDSTIRQIRPDRVVLSGPKGEIVLRLTFDKLHSTSLATPGTPVFPQPGFNPGFPNQGFNPAFNAAVPGFQGQPAPPVVSSSQGADDSTDGAPGPAPVPAPPFPGFRGPNIPRGRE